MAKIIVVGSSNTDLVIQTDRFPNPGETIIGRQFFIFPGGKGANQAVAAARLGGEVTLIARIGKDHYGNEAISLFQKEKIDASFIIRDETHSSGIAFILVNNEGENEIVVASGANNHLSIDDVLCAEHLIDQADIILAQLETPVECITRLIEICGKKKKRIILNPAPAQPLENIIWNQLFLITPNETEAEILTGIPVQTLDDADQAASALLDKGVQHVVITMGASGALYKAKNDMFFIKANKVESIDTTGAGDVFNGAIAVALAEGKDWREAVQFATNAAGISVTRMGAQSSAPYLSELS